MPTEEETIKISYFTKGCQTTDPETSLAAASYQEKDEGLSYGL